MTHGELVAVAERWLSGTRRCNVVLTEQGFGTERCDAMGWWRYLIVVEAKVSRADFFADAQKPHRQHACGLGRERWYLTPQGLIGASDVPDGWGLLEWTGRIVRRVKPAPEIEHRPEMWMHELAIALGELRKYHAQGIRYRKLSASGGYADDGALGSLATALRGDREARCDDAGFAACGETQRFRYSEGNDAPLAWSDTRCDLQEGHLGWHEGDAHGLRWYWNVHAHGILDRRDGG